MSRVLLLPETSRNKPALQREAQQGGNKYSCRLFLSRVLLGHLLLGAVSFHSQTQQTLRQFTSGSALAGSPSRGKRRGEGTKLKSLICRARQRCPHLRTSLSPEARAAKSPPGSLPVLLLCLVISLSEPFRQAARRGRGGEPVGDAERGGQGGAPRLGLQSKADSGHEAAERTPAQRKGSSEDCALTSRLCRPYLPEGSSVLANVESCLRGRHCSKHCCGHYCSR